MTGADSWVDVKGSGWLIKGNDGRNSPMDGFQTHEIVNGWGTRNTFQNNTVASSLPGQAIHLAPRLANVIGCGNTGPRGARIPSDQRC